MPHEENMKSKNENIAEELLDSKRVYPSVHKLKGSSKPTEEEKRKAKAQRQKARESTGR